MHFPTQGFDSQAEGKNSRKVKVNYLPTLPLIIPHLYIHLLIHVSTHLSSSQCHFRFFLHNEAGLLITGLAMYMQSRLMHTNGP